MAMGRQGDRQGELMVMWSEMLRSPGHVFYDRLQEVLVGAGFEGFVEDACQAYYARTMGAPSVRPGRYFRMHMVGYFEGIDSERGIEWRCSFFGRAKTRPGSSNGTGSRHPPPCGRTSFHPRHGPRRTQTGVSLTESDT